MPKTKSLKKRGGSCQVNNTISKSPCFDVDVSQYKSPCKHLPLDSAQMKAQTGGKRSARKNKKRNLRKNKKSLKKRKQKGGEPLEKLSHAKSLNISDYLDSLNPNGEPEMGIRTIREYFQGISTLNLKVSYIESQLSTIMSTFQTVLSRINGGSNPVSDQAAQAIQ